MPVQSFSFISSNQCLALLLLLLVWLPLPWGSNAVWAESLMLVALCGIALLWLKHYWQGHQFISPVIQKSALILILWGLWLVYITFQIIPLPIAILQYLSPQALYWQQQVYPELQWGYLSLDWSASWRGLLRSISYVLLFTLVLLTVQSQRQVRWLVYALLVSGVFQAVYGSIMTLSGLELGFIYEKQHYRGVATGTFVNRNHLAGYLVMCLALGIGLLMSLLDDKSWSHWRQLLRHFVEWLLSNKMLIRIALVLMVITLVLTHSRMGNSSFFAALLIASVIALFLSRRAPRATVILLISLIIIDVSIVGTWFGLEKIAKRLEQTSLTQETRDEVDFESLTYWQDYPITGSGLGSYYGLFRPYQQQKSGAEFYEHAHNDYLEFATETGLIGISLLGLILLSTLTLVLTTQYRRRTPLFRGLATAVTMSIIALLIHSTVDFNLQIPANAATFVVVLALGWIVSYLPRTRRSSRKSLRPQLNWQKNSYC